MPGKFHSSKHVCKSSSSLLEVLLPVESHRQNLKKSLTHSLRAYEFCAKAKPKPCGEDAQGLPLEGRLSPGQRLTSSVKSSGFSGKIHQQRCVFTSLCLLSQIFPSGRLSHFSFAGDIGRRRGTSQLPTPHTL